ncbi:flippase-like domain-containing protein [Streptomyces sp. 205]|uniref:Flippase-like domain-containing protein n=1 Tax=Streptomyces coffeae TaxID=621382 RepID=A0ABS1NI03_9ACTN|nr:flippase-like domain-containing protein [Streptomyces coffeae]
MSGAVRARLGAVAGAAILTVLLWRLGTGAFVDGLRRIDGPTLLGALGLGLLTTVFSAWRWCLVARGLRIRLPLGRAVADYYRSLFLNAALPGGVLGDVHRAVRHGRTAGDVGRGVRAVVLERVAGQVVLIAVGMVLLLAHPAVALEQTRRVAAAPGAVPVLAVVAAGLVALVVRSRRRGAAAPSRGRRALRGALAEARRGLLARGSWPGVAVASAVVLTGHVAMFLLAARAAGSTAPVAVLVPLLVLALIAMALPLNVGGWGPREGVTAWAFGAAGLGAGQGLSVAVVYGVLTFAASLPGIAVLIGQWIAGLRHPQVEFEEGVLAEDTTAHGRSERVPQYRGTGEPESGDTVADQDRRHGDVEPVQRPLVQKAGHGHPAALDQYPAQAAPRECVHQAVGGERVAVRQRQHLHAVRGGRTLAVGGHHPQRRR